MIDPETRVVKLIDFGFACSCREKLRVFCGTPSFMSPEIVSNRDYLGPAADVWACGVILHLMLTGSLPFKSHNEKDLFRKIQKGTYTFTHPRAVTTEAVQRQSGGNKGTFDPGQSVQQAEAPVDTNSFSHEVKDLLKQLLTLDQEKRITAQASIAHRWFYIHAT
jgi:serine/threonine protein kinase